MKKVKMAKAVVTGVLAAGLVASGAGLALAKSGTTVASGMSWLTGNGVTGGNVVEVSDGNTGGKPMRVPFRAFGNQETLKDALADLVSAGTITQAQADAVLAYFEQNTPAKPVVKATPPASGKNQGPRPKMVDPLENLVSKGTLTEAQAQAIRDKERDLAEQQRQKEWQTVLNTLVGEGTITQTQATKILAFQAANEQKMESSRENMKNLFAQTKNMTSQQRAQYLKENMPKPSALKDPLTQMVDQGIITQAQADALKQAMQEQGQQQMQQQVQDNLNALAAKGTITQDQAGKILAFLTADQQKMQTARTQARENMKNLFAQTKNMTPQQRAQYLKQHMPAIEDPVSQMVDQGIITQAQADAVRQALRVNGFGMHLFAGPAPGGPGPAVSASGSATSGTQS